MLGAVQDVGVARVAQDAKRLRGACVGVEVWAIAWEFTFGFPAGANGTVIAEVVCHVVWPFGSVACLNKNRMVDRARLRLWRSLIEAVISFQE